MWQARNRKRFVILLMGWVCLILGVVIGATRTYHAVKRWRAQQLAAQSTVCLAKSNLLESQRKVQAALLLDPKEPAVLRAAVKTQAAAGRMGAIPIWQRLLALGQASIQDRRDYVEFCLKLKRLTLAEAELRKLTLEFPHDAANLWLFSQLSLARGDVFQSIEFASQAVDSEPSNRRYRLFLNSVQFDTEDPSVRQAVRQRVWEIAQGPDAVGLEAIVFLARRSDLCPSEIGKVFGLFEKHSEAIRTHWLLRLDLELRLEPTRKAALLQAAEERSRTGTETEFAEFIVWLNGHREFEQVLKSLPMDRAMQRRDLFILRMDALGGLDRWQEIQGILGRANLPVSPTLLQAFKARTLSQLGQTNDAGFAWRRALQAAADHVEELEFLFEYACRNQEPTCAIRAYRTLLRVAPDALPTQAALPQFLAQRGATTDLRDLAEELSSRSPQIAAFRNDLAYLNLLLGKDIEASKRIAEGLVAENPWFLSMRTTLALACLRLNEPARALEAYGEVRHDWTHAMPAHQAVYIATLFANQKSDRARQMVANLPLESLRVEERALIPVSLMRDL